MLVPLQHWSLEEQNKLFAAIVYILYSKRVKVFFRPKKVSSSNKFLLRNTKHMDRLGNPFSPIGFNG